MSKLGGGMYGMGELPDSFNLVINTNHIMAKKILDTKEKKRKNYAFFVYMVWLGNAKSRPFLLNRVRISMD